MEEHITTNIDVLHDHQLAVEEEEEESLSLCDLPLELDTKNSLQNLQHDRTRIRTQKSSAEPAPDFFEFLKDKNSSDMCPADDIISGGKLIPLLKTSQTQQNPVLRKRSESLNELRSNSSTKSKTALLRNSRSLDDQKQKLHRADIAAERVKRPRWYVFMFGTVKFPPEMELKDIKSRQFRRNIPSVMFSDNGKKLADNRSSDKGSSSSWCLLKALSCRDYTSVAVTSSFYLSQA